jgi:prolyl-tRNA synthetase
VLHPVAPIQAMVVAVRDDERTVAVASAIAGELADAGVRVRLDARSTPGFGRRIVEWELKGVPLRVEVGPRDLDAQQATIARRDLPGKTPVPLDQLSAAAPAMLEAIQAELYEQARQRLADKTADVETVPDAIAAASTGFAKIPYASLGESGEDQLAANAITVRCLQTPQGDLPTAGITEELFAILARSY